MARLWNQCPTTEKWFETKFEATNRAAMLGFQITGVGVICPICRQNHELTTKNARWLDETGQTVL